MKAETKKNVPNEIVEDGNIDKIRDILFGSQSRDFERRFIKLEERINKEINDMRDENRRKLDALEDFIKSEVKSLTERLANEQNTRVDADKELSSELKGLSHNLSNELKDLSHNFDKKVTNINEQAAKSESDIRQQILNQSKNLTDEIQKRHNDMNASLERESTEIRDDKADKTALAQLFTEMALRLTNDFKLPGTDD